MKKIDPELKKILQADLKKYLREFPDATPEEIREVRDWVKAGNSPYDNSWLFYNDYGWPMDFITAERNAKEMQEFYERDPEGYRKWWGLSSDDLVPNEDEEHISGDDLPF